MPDTNPYMDLLGQQPAVPADAPADAFKAPPSQAVNPYMDLLPKPAEKKASIFSEIKPVAEALTKFGRDAILTELGAMSNVQAKDMWEKTIGGSFGKAIKNWVAVDKEFGRLTAPDSPDMEAEKARRRQDHMPTDDMTMQKWAYQQAHESVFGPKEPDKTIKQYAQEMYDTAVAHPGQFAASFIESARYRPEIFLGGVTGAITIGTAEATLEQFGEKGRIDPSKVAFDSAMLALPPLAVHTSTAAIKLASKGVKANETVMMESFANKVKAGLEAPDALEEVFLSMAKASPEEQQAILTAAKPHLRAKSEAVAAASTVKEEVPYAADEGKVEAGRVEQHTEAPARGAEAEPSRGDRDVSGGEKPPQEKEEVAPQEQPTIDEQARAKLAVNLKGMPLDELKSYTSMLKAQAKQGGEAGAKATRYLEVLDAEMARRKEGLKVVEPEEAPAVAKTEIEPDVQAKAGNEAVEFRGLWDKAKEKFGVAKARQLVIDGEAETKGQSELNQWLKDRLGPIAIAGGVAIGAAAADDEDKKNWIAAGMMLEGGFYSPAAKHFSGRGTKGPNWSKTGSLPAKEFIKHIDARVRDGILSDAEIEHLGLRDVARLLDEKGKPVTKQLVEQIIKNNGLEIKATEFAQDRVGNEPRFEQYQLPGAVNPREIVLSFPQGAFDVAFNENLHYPGIPNKVAHFRVNDRIGAGKPTLFVEEAQFDWAQQARDKGVATPQVQRELGVAERRLNSIDHEIDAVEAQAMKYPVEHPMRGKLEDDRYELLAEAMELEEKLGKAPVPMGPMLKDNAARTLAWKGILKYASENGYDHIAWTRGDQQYKRYATFIEQELAAAEKVNATKYVEELKAKRERIKRGMDTFYGDENGKTSGGEDATWSKDLQRVLRDLKQKAEFKPLDFDTVPENIRTAEAGPAYIGRQPAIDLNGELKAAAIEPLSMFNQRGAITLGLKEWMSIGAGAGTTLAMGAVLSPDTEYRLLKLAAAGVGAAVLARALHPIAKGGMDLYRGMSKHPVNPKDVFRDANAVNAIGAFTARQMRKQWEAAFVPPMFTHPMERMKWEAGGRDQTYTAARDYMQGHRDDQVMGKLNEQQIAALDNARAFLSQHGDLMVQNGLMNAESVNKWRETYLTGLYRKPMGTSWTEIVDKLANLGTYGDDIRTGMFPKTRFARSKVFPDYRTVEKLRAEGKIDLEPITNNPFEIIEHYLKSTSKALMVKKLLDSLRKTAGPMSTTITKGPRTGEEVPIPLMVEHLPDANRAHIAGNIRRVQANLGLDKEWGDFAIKQFIANAPKDYVTINHPALEGWKVYKDLKGPMEMLFDVKEPGQIERALYNLSLTSKSLYFLGSMFHAGTLGLVAATAALPRTLMPAEFKRSANFLRLLFGGDARAALQGRGPLAAEARRFMADDLTVHLPDDVLGYGVIDNFLGWMSRAGENTGSGSAWAEMGKQLKDPGRTTAAGMRTINRWFQHILWDEVQPTLKLALAFSELEKSIDVNTRANIANPRKTPLRDIHEMRREVSKGVNDLMGGQNWFANVNNVDNRIARSFLMSLESPHGRRMQQIAFISPDWVVSATRAWYEGIKSLWPTVSPKASDSMYRGYLTWSAMMYLGVGEYIYQKYNNDPTHRFWEVDNPGGAWGIPLGDGRYININKHFMEPVHAINNPAKFIVNKLNYLPKETAEQLFGREFLTPTGGPPMADTSFIGRLEHAAYNLAPIALKTSQLDAKDQKRVDAMLLNYFGFPIFGLTDERLAEKSAVRSVEKAVQRAEAKKPGDEFAAESARQKAEFEQERVKQRVMKRREKAREESKDKADESKAYKLRKRVQSALDIE